MIELTILNPVANTKTQKADLTPRLSDLNGKTIGLFWNAKAGGDILLKESAELLEQRYSGIKFKNYLGAVGSLVRYATEEQAEAIAKECDAVIGATAD